MYPLDDQIIKFSNSTQVKLHYGKDASGEEGVSPKATHDWGDPTTNEHFSRFETEDVMVDLLTQSIFTVTAYHEIIGTIIDYGRCQLVLLMRRKVPFQQMSRLI